MYFSTILIVCECHILSLTPQDFYSCDHLPLFELGSCHYHHYLINLRFPSLPLNHRDDFRGSVVIDKLNLFVRSSIDLVELFNSSSSSSSSRRFTRRQNSHTSGSYSSLWCFHSLWSLSSTCCTEYLSQHQAFHWFTSKHHHYYTTSDSTPLVIMCYQLIVLVTNGCLHV